MITLFASIAGFITSIIPEILKFFRDKQDKLHELEIFEKQIKFSKIAPNTKSPEEIYITSHLSERLALYSTYTTGISTIDTLNGSVRPILAYSFFIIYVAIKFIQYSEISKSDDVMKYIEILWSLEDQAIFASIISFYFGQRTFSKLNHKNRK